jgi:hypothetical protein
LYPKRNLFVFLDDFEEEEFDIPPPKQKSRAKAAPQNKFFVNERRSSAKQPRAKPPTEVSKNTVADQKDEWIVQRRYVPKPRSRLTQEQKAAEVRKAERVKNILKDVDLTIERYGFARSLIPFFIELFHTIAFFFT